MPIQKAHLFLKMMEISKLRSKRKLKSLQPTSLKVKRKRKKRRLRMTLLSWTQLMIEYLFASERLPIILTKSTFG